MSHWFSQGNTIEALHLDDRALHYGDGLFETIAIRDGEARFLDDHLARLQTGCLRLGISPPPTARLQAELDAAIAASGTDRATVKLIVSAGVGPRGYHRTHDAVPTVLVGVYAAHPLPDAFYRSGVAVRLCAGRLAIQPQLAGIKTLNRLEQVLARSEWDDESIFEGLMLDTGKRLICGTMSNVFIVRQNSVATPAITRCGVAGIMRGRVVRMLEDAGVPCDVRDVHRDELFAADEVFLTNSQFGILPVRQCAAQEWPVAAVTRKLMQIAAGNGVPECAA